MTMPADKDDTPAANDAFMLEHVVDELSDDDAVDMISGDLDRLFGDDNQDEVEEDGHSGDDGQSEEEPDDGEEEEDANPKGKGKDAPEGEEVDDSGGLLVRGEDGKLKPVGLDDVEVPISIDGEEQVLTLAEIQQEFTDNRLRRDDYTRKTQDIANRVRSEVDKVVGERQTELDRGFEQLDVVLAAFGGQLDKDVSFEDLKAKYGDSDKAGAALVQMQSFKKTMKDAVEARDKRAQEVFDQNIDATLQDVRADHKEWKDPKVFQASLVKTRDFLTKSGLDDSDIGAILQKPAYLRLVLGAMEGARLKSRLQSKTTTKKNIRLGKGSARTQTKATRRAPGRPQKRQADPFANLNGETGLRPDDAALMIERMLD